jgi:CRISPR-associated endonuclease Csn1
MNYSNYTLGIDMGVASIGWAMVSIAEQQIDSGVRVFPAGIDNFNSGKEKHANVDRRTARTMRRRIRRKAERKKLISQILTELDWIPKDQVQLEIWRRQDIYGLRHRALTEKITLQELARIILHLNQRRGFLSLRKTEGETDKDTQGMLGEISALQKEIDDSGPLSSLSKRWYSHSFAESPHQAPDASSRVFAHLGKAELILSRDSHRRIALWQHWQTRKSDESN